MKGKGSDCSNYKRHIGVCTPVLLLVRARWTKSNGHEWQWSSIMGGGGGTKPCISVNGKQASCEKLQKSSQDRMGHCTPCVLSGGT